MPGRALVIGSGPNGLSAAIVLAQGGWQVEVHEAASHLGGAASSGEITEPGFLHDLGSAVHPLALASPFFSSLPLEVDWIHSPLALAHPFDHGTAAVLYHDVNQTADALGPDSKEWKSLFGPVVCDWEAFRHELLAPLGWTNHPFRMARFGWNAMLSASELLKRFKGPAARALFAGLAAHYPLMNQAFSGGIGIVLGAAAHTVGWPIPKGGAQQITNALIRRLEQLGGTVHRSSPVRRLSGTHQLVLADTSPRALAGIAKDRLPSKFRARLERYRYGPGSFKVDWALNAPIPWQAQECSKAATVHLGGSAEEILRNDPERPYVLLAQPTLFDPTRAPEGKHIAWAYCHVENGSSRDMTASIETQIERFAPGFRDAVISRRVSSPLKLEQDNANLVGGDVTGGVADLSQLLFRPTWRRYATPDPAIWICSAATPPGPGVHGMCGFHAATRALKA